MQGQSWNRRHCCRHATLISGALMALGHGLRDAPRTMGIITFGCHRTQDRRGLLAHLHGLDHHTAGCGSFRSRRTRCQSHDFRLLAKARSHGVISTRSNPYFALSQLIHEPMLIGEGALPISGKIKIQGFGLTHTRIAVSHDFHNQRVYSFADLPILCLPPQVVLPCIAIPNQQHRSPRT